MTEQLSELGQAALEYVHAGFGVFPLHAGKKTPMTKHGYKDWTDDPDSVRAVWGKYPNANIGIACGEPSGNLVVIDVDKDDDAGYDGADSLREWEREHGKLPETACAVTGRGGVHYYYRTDGRKLHIDSNPDMHIDVRTDGGFVMAAPSIHPNGNAMYWDLHYEDYPIAEADETVYALIDAIYDHDGGKASESPKVDASGGFKKGGRNNQLYKMACGLMAQSWDDDAIIASIETYNSMSKNPLPKHEVDKLLRSALSKPKGKSDEWYAQHVDNPFGDDGNAKTRGRPRKFDHAGIAEKLIAENGACMVDGMPAIRHGNTYQIGWNAVNKEIILLNRDATRANQREVQHYLTVMAENKIQSPPNLIAFKNGVLDIKTMQLRDYSDDDVIPNVIPCNWNENAECESVDSVLRKMSCGDDDVFESLIEVMGVCMYRSPEFTQSAILLGDGSNGKSTFIRMLTALLGKNNIATISMTQIGKQFLVGRLAGKLANLGSEVSNEFKGGDLLSTFKELVDGNRMHADVKGVEGFDFENYATMVLCANEFPKLADTTDGMMRRIFPIEFNARFRKTDPDYDPRIAQKVSSKKACEYMAFLGVLGLQNVIKHNGFTPNAASDRRLEEIKTENDSALAWINACGWHSDDLHDTSTSKHYANYKDWCFEYGCQAYGHAKFTKLVNKHLGLECVKKRVNGVPTNCFQYRNNAYPNS